MKYQKLNDFIATRQDTPFKWGEHDCCLFVCDCVEVMSGVDISTSFRGNYDDESSAYELVEKAGGIRAIATAALGAEINPLLAQRGDIVMIEQPKETLGVCVGSLVAMPGAKGLQRVPIRMATAAWRCPECLL